MKRLTLAILLLGLAVLTIPPLRARAQPHIDGSREWLGQKLEGPLSPILTPYRTLRTESTMGEVVRRLVRDRNRGQDPPRPDYLDEYLEHARIRTTDHWGAPFILQQEPDSLAIISAGEDLEYHTEDDLVYKIRYDDPAHSRRRRR